MSFLYLTISLISRNTFLFVSEHLEKPCFRVHFTLLSVHLLLSYWTFIWFLKAGFVQGTSFAILRNTTRESASLSHTKHQGSQKTNLSLDNVDGSRKLHVRSLNITGMSIQGEDLILLSCSYLNLRHLTRNSCTFGSTNRHTRHCKPENVRFLIRHNGS